MSTEVDRESTTAYGTVILQTEYPQTSLRETHRRFTAHETTLAGENYLDWLAQDFTPQSFPTEITVVK